MIESVKQWVLCNDFLLAYDYCKTESQYNLNILYMAVTALIILVLYVKEVKHRKETNDNNDSYSAYGLSFFSLVPVAGVIGGAVLHILLVGGFICLIIYVFNQTLKQIAKWI